jgi:hypothetical protein
MWLRGTAARTLQPYDEPDTNKETNVRTIPMTAVGLAFLLSACSGISTSTDYDPDVNFANYSTYVWIDTEGDDDHEHVDAISHGRIQSAVDGVLATKGLRKATSNPDLAVGYQVTSAERRSYNTVNTGWGGGYYWGGWGGGMGMSTTTENVWEEGSLILGLFDSETKNLVWTGTATAAIDPGRSPEERQRLIEDAVAKMMKDFPPGG